MNLTPEQKRELLTLAAKAGGYAVVPHPNRNALRSLMFTLNGRNWNPIHDDGDEARLESVLDFDVIRTPDVAGVGDAGVNVGKDGVFSFYSYAECGGDKQAARRLAGTRAAAEIRRTL